MAEFKQNYFQRRTKDRGPRSNNRIMSQEVQVISSDGKNLGILNTQEAINMAKNEGLDLIKIYQEMLHVRAVQEKNIKDVAGDYND